MKPLRVGAITAAIAISLSFAARADVVLSGPTTNAAAYSTAALAAFATPGTTFSSGGFTGVSLWGLLGGADASPNTSPVWGAITTSTPAGHNGSNSILRYYVSATGAGGQTSVISLGELAPFFGGTAPTPPIVAFQSSGGLLAAPQLVFPNAPARNVSDLTSLSILAVPSLPSAPRSLSTSVTLSGEVTKPGVYDAGALADQFPPITTMILGTTFTGTPLWDFLNPLAPMDLDQIVVARSTDGYEAVFSLAELNPGLGGNPSNFLPYQDLGSNGLARTILANDSAKKGRWASNVYSIEVIDTVPSVPLGQLPLALNVMLLALAGVVFARFRRTNSA